jgi:hypothetical protein
MFVYTNECFRMGFPCRSDADCATQGSGAGPATCRGKACHAAVWEYIPAGLDQPRASLSLRAHLIRTCSIAAMVVCFFEHVQWRWALNGRLARG